MNDVLATLMDALEKIRRARRTLIVHPGDYGPVTARVYSEGMSHFVEVHQSEHVEPGQLIVIEPSIYGGSRDDSDGAGHVRFRPRDPVAWFHNEDRYEGEVRQRLGFPGPVHSS